MARENGRWRITEVKNVQQLLQHFEQQKGLGGPSEGSAEIGGRRHMGAPAAPPSNTRS